ncbi:MAG: pyridoxamine 5'-phosphate oxidase family protein [Elusimicrobiota bacterium]|jgi:uncharacterized pyridoxamine 5'-phosphate oxidase family protein|nr:pyridoxamine 5'-phosphate oxidase family protein [Elusimicrobiota bacterium]
MNKKIVDFVKECGIFYIATSERGNARVRPFTFIEEIDGKIYFATGTEKEVYKQLKNNPYFEICAALKDGSKWIRARACASFDDLLSVKQKVFEIMPDLIEIYGSPASPKFTVFYAKSIEASIFSIAGGCEKIV